MKARKLVTLVLALVLVLVCGMQIAADSVEVTAVCNHVFDETGSITRRNYSYQGSSTHTYEVWLGLQCLKCSSLSNAYDRTVTESCDIAVTRFPYSGGTICERTYCTGCNHIFSDRVITD